MSYQALVSRRGRKNRLLDSVPNYLDILKERLNGFSVGSQDAAEMLEQVKYWQAGKHPFTVNRFLQQLIQEQLKEASQKASVNAY